MKIGETITHNGIEAVLVEEEVQASCLQCCFFFWTRLPNGKGETVWNKKTMSCR